MGVSEMLFWGEPVCRVRAYLVCLLDMFRDLLCDSRRFFPKILILEATIC